MTYCDGYAHDLGASGVSGEVSARLVEYLGRQVRGAGARLESLRKAVETHLGTSGVGGGLLDLARRVREQLFTRRHGGTPVETVGDEELRAWEALCVRIENYGREGTIERYEEHLFVV